MSPDFALVLCKNIRLISLDAVTIFKSERGPGKMAVFKRTLIFTFLALLLVLEANALVAQEHFSTFIGTTVGVQGMFRQWLDVKNDRDGLIVNFRIGRDTVYTPHRYPYPGEKVKVEYLPIRGVDVAYRVTVLGEHK